MSRDSRREVPFSDMLEISVTDHEDGYAVGRLPLQPKHSSTPETGVAHGGVPYSLADHVAGAAVGSLVDGPCPTIDMRIDYHRPALGEFLRAEARVKRNGTNVAVVDVTVTNDQDVVVAEARGTFKTGGAPEDSPWDPEA